MNKFQLLSKTTGNLKKKGYKIKITLNEPRSNPLFEVSKGDKKIYIVICEAGIKTTKYPKIVFCGISPKIQSLIEIEKVYEIIIDFQPSKPRFILVKLDSTNYRRNKIDYIIYNLNRPDYSDFFNTENIQELINEIQNVIK